MEKVIKNGEVAIVYSPRYGAGWSTWASEEQRETLIFHPAIVNMVLKNKQSEIDKSWMKKNLGKEYEDVYLGGADDLCVEWVPFGTVFRITEYDGFESVEIYDTDDYFVA